MDLPGKHVKYLAKTIGSRAAGSDGEAAAASYVLRTFEDLDIEVDTESFSSWKSDHHGILILYVLALGGYLLFPVSFTWSFILLALVFFIFQMESYTWSVVSKLLPRTPASNIVGKVRSCESRSARVLLVANYDSAKSSPLGNRFLARIYRFIYVLSFICITLLALVSLVGLLATVAKVKRETLMTVWLFASPIAGYLLVLSILIAWGEIFGRYSPGANDNASGVGVMVSTLAAVAENPLAHTEVWGVATARGVAGGRGMVALIKRHRRQIKKAYIINIDHPGSGTTRVIRVEGPMLGFRCSRKLKRIAMRAPARCEDLEVGKGRCRVKKSDGMVALARWKKAITIGGLTGGTYRGWRNKNDSYDEIDRESLDGAMKLVKFMLEKIDRG